LASSTNPRSWAMNFNALQVAGDRWATHVESPVLLAADGSQKRR
jgi:hypothetical protein